jgi:hypothetical protein
MGLDVAYIKFQSATMPNGISGGTCATGAPGCAGFNTNTLIFNANSNTLPRFLDNEATWQVRFRVHRDFYP